MAAIQTHRRPQPPIFAGRLLTFTAVSPGDNTIFLDKIEVLNPAGQPVAGALLNGSFQDVLQGNGYLGYLGQATPDPAQAWHFVNGSGIATNGSPFGQADAPDGNAVAFLQGQTAAISQELTMPAGTYRLRLYAVQRPGNEQQVLVSAGSRQILNLLPAVYGTWVQFTSAPFTVL